MAAELIGFENLPNVFIKEISIHKYSNTENKIKVSVSLQDDLINPVWYDPSMILTKLLQVGVLFTDDVDKIQEFNSGTVDIKNNSIMKKSLGMKTKDDNYMYFELSFEKIVPKSTVNLNIYAFCFIDKKSVLETHGFEMESHYYGPIKGEVVYNNNNLNSNTFVFLRSDNTYWPGPVHSMGNKFMIGSYHNENQEEYLTRLMVKNTKIKDYTERENTSIDRDDMNENIISKLLVSYNSNTDINNIFMLNMKSLIKNKTKYGKFLKRASKEIVDNIVQQLRISLLTIERERVKTKMLPSKLQSKKQTVVKKVNNKSLIKTYDSGDTLASVTRLEKNGTFDIIEEELRSNTTGLSRKNNEIFKEEIDSYKKISKVSELFLQYSNDIRTFQFNDYELQDKTPGMYRYKLKLSFIDPFEKFIKNIFSEMYFDLSEIKKYFMFVKRKKEPTEANIDIFAIVKSYVDKYSYLYVLEDLQKSIMFDKLINLLEPSVANIKSVNLFMKKYEDLMTEYVSITEYDEKKKVTNNRKIAVKSKDAMSKRIYFEHLFHEIVEPSKNQLNFGYFDAKESENMKTFSKRQIEERSDEEANNNYVSQPKLESKNLNPRVSKRLEDVYSMRTTYFAPKYMKSSAEKFTLGLDSSIPHNQINTGFKRKSIASARGAKSLNDFATRAPKTAPEERNDDSQFVLSADSIGDNSNFVQYDEQYDSFNVIEAETESKIKLDNLNSGFQNNRSYSEVQTTTRKITELDAFMLPIQLKAVIAGGTQFTRNSYSAPGIDVLSDPNTKNYYELNNFSVKKLIYIDGFETDSNGNVLLNKPVMRDMTTSNFVSLQKPVICKLVSYTNDLFRIYDNDILGVDSVFILSDTDVTTLTESTTNNNQPIYNISMISYEFMNSVIVQQSNQQITVKI
jgi:hypothetical protein